MSVDVTEPRTPASGTADWLHRWCETNQDCGLIFMTPEAVVVQANPAIERVLGYRPDELVGHTLSCIFTPEDIARGLDRHELEVARRLGRAEDDRWHLGKNGRRVWASGVLCEVRNESGSLLGFVKMFRDRTDQHTEVASLRSAVEHAAAMLARQDEALATVGHELRNPVGTLAQAAAVLRAAHAGSIDIDAADRALAIVDRQLALLRRLAQDLRDASQVSSAPTRLALEQVVLQTVIRTAVAAHAAEAQRRRHRVETVLPEPAIDIEADPVRLGQILGNLLENAIKYTPDGGTVSVTATVEGPQALIRVEDNGIGIGADAMPAIFGLFTRDTRVVDSAETGLGVGLAVVKRLVSLHHGVIEAQSPGPAKGSRFTVSLPLKQS